MRICHVSPHLPPDQAANALLPAELGKWAAARGHDVSFVTQPPAQTETVLAAESLPGQVRRVAARRAATGLVRMLRLDAWRRARSITSALDEVAADADLLHLHSNGFIVEVAALWAIRRHKPFVLTLYGTEIWHYRRRWPIDPFTRAYRRAAAVTFYSDRLRKRAQELGLDRPGLDVIYPAVRPAFFATSDLDRERLRRDLGLGGCRVVLNVKRLHELAGQQYLIEAVARLVPSNPDLRLVICGTGPLLDELRRKTRTLLLDDVVTFTGLISNDEVARYACAADVFALPSLLEAMPTVAVEALACGTPVVTADHPGGEELRELFGEDVTVVRRRDVESLAGALEAALRTTRRASPAAAGLIAERFSPDAVERMYEAVYGRVLGGLK